MQRTHLSLFCRHLEKRDCCPFFRNDVHVVKSVQNRADMSIHFFRKLNFSFTCFEHYKVSHLLSQVLSMKFCAVNAWVCLSSPHTLKKKAFFFKTLVENHTVALKQSARRSRNYIILQFITSDQVGSILPQILHHTDPKSHLIVVMTPGKKQTNILLFKDKQTNKLKKKTNILGYQWKWFLENRGTGVDFAKTANFCCRQRKYIKRYKKMWFEPITY